MPIKVRDAIKAIEADGWFMLPRKGTNHKQFKHPNKPGKVTITGNPGNTLDMKDVVSIEKQSGVKLR